MNTPLAIIISGTIIAGAILLHDKLPTTTDNSSFSTGRYMALNTDALIRINVIDTHTGAVRHCWTDDYQQYNQQYTAHCSKWIGTK